MPGAVRGCLIVVGTIGVFGGGCSHENKEGKGEHPGEKAKFQEEKSEILAILGKHQPDRTGIYDMASLLLSAAPA